MNEMKDNRGRKKNFKGQAITFSAGKQQDGIVHVIDQKDNRVYCRFIYIKKNKESRFLPQVIMDVDDFQRIMSEAKQRPLMIVHRSDNNRQPHTLSFVYSQGEKKPNGEIVENSYYPYMLANYIINLPNGRWENKTEFADGNGYNYCKENILLRKGSERIRGDVYLKALENSSITKKPNTILIKKQR